MRPATSWMTGKWRRLALARAFAVAVSSPAATNASTRAAATLVAGAGEDGGEPDIDSEVVGLDADTADRRTCSRTNEHVLPGVGLVKRQGRSRRAAPVA
jgi:hypothetical protein